LVPVITYSRRSRWSRSHSIREILFGSHVTENVHVTEKNSGSVLFSLSNSPLLIFHQNICGLRKKTSW
jgi:hypothetical protein